MKRIAVLLIVLASACARTGNDSSVQNDTASVPVGPGTDTSALRPPDTPGSPPDRSLDSVPKDTTHGQRRR